MRFMTFIHLKYMKVMFEHSQGLFIFSVCEKIKEARGYRLSKVVALFKLLCLYIFSSFFIIIISLDIPTKSYRYSQFTLPY